MKINIEETELVLNDNPDFIFGYEFSPKISGNTPDVNSNVDYYFKRWTYDDKCQTNKRCMIPGRFLEHFLITDVKCGRFPVYLIVRKSPYKPPICL